MECYQHIKNHSIGSKHHWKYDFYGDAVIKMVATIGDLSAPCISAFNMAIFNISNKLVDQKSSLTNKMHLNLTVPSKKSTLARSVLFKSSEK